MRWYFKNKKRSTESQQIIYFWKKYPVSMNLWIKIRKRKLIKSGIFIGTAWKNRYMIHFNLKKLYIKLLTF